MWAGCPQPGLGPGRGDRPQTPPDTRHRDRGDLNPGVKGEADREGPRRKHPARPEAGARGEEEDLWSEQRLHSAVPHPIPTLSRRAPGVREEFSRSRNQANHETPLALGALLGAEIPAQIPALLPPRLLSGDPSWRAGPCSGRRASSTPRPALALRGGRAAGDPQVRTAPSQHLRWGCGRLGSSATAARA